MPRVLHITPVYFPSVGGIEDVVRSLAACAVRAGWAADIAEVRTSNHCFFSEKDGSSVVFRVPLYGSRLIGVAPRLRQLIDRYDVIHVHDPQLMAISANARLFRSGKPLLLSTHGGFFHTSSHSVAKSLHAAVTARLMLDGYNAILASSASDQRMFRRFSNRVELVPNGANTQKFDKVERNGAKDRLHWIYWGRFSRNKRIDLVIRYAASARERGFPVRLLVCGTDFDGLQGSFQSLIRDLGITEHVAIIGTPSDRQLIEHIKKCSVFVTASQFEGFGLSVVEAMAAGLTVMCRNIPPLNEFVRPGENGALLSFDESATDMQLLYDFLSRSGEQLDQESHNNRVTAQRYSWDAAADGFLEVYRRFGVSGNSADG